MGKWLRRVRGALGMALAWAIIWAAVGGGIMELLVDPHGKILDMWPQTLAIPGFFGGLVFSGLLWVAEGRRKFEELSLARFAVWGAAVGLLLGALALGTGAARSVAPFWFRGAIILGPVALLSTLSAAASLTLARLAVRRHSLEAGTDARERLGEGD